MGVGRERQRRRKSKYKCVPWRHGGSHRNWVGWGLQYRTLLRLCPWRMAGRVSGQSRILWLQSPLTADFSGGINPLSFRVRLHLGWVEWASLLQHQKQALGRKPGWDPGHAGGIFLCMELSRKAMDETGS